MWKGREYLPRDPDVRYWMLRFGLKQSRIPGILTRQTCEWLAGCKDDAARRLMLGIGNKRDGRHRLAKQEGAKVAA
jgi:hypothetical protein